MTRRRARRVKNVKNSTMSRSIPLCLVMIGQAGAQRRSDMWRFEVGDVGRSLDTATHRVASLGVPRARRFARENDDDAHGRRARCNGHDCAQRVLLRGARAHGGRSNGITVVIGFRCARECGTKIAPGKRSYPHGEGGGGRMCNACGQRALRAKQQKR